MAALGDEVPRGVISAAVTAAGFDLEELTVTSAGGKYVVRVIVDSDHGVDLDRAAAVSRAVAEILDAEGERLFDDRPYTLEVTSPGIGAPLTLPRHFRRAVGRLVDVTRLHGATSRMRIARVDDETITGVADGKEPSVMMIPLADIARAKVEVEFSAPPAAVTDLMQRIAAGDVAAADAAAEDEGI